MCWCVLVHDGNPYLVNMMNVIICCVYNLNQHVF